MNNVPHPALEKAPKSLREALMRIQKHLRHGKVARMKYRYADGSKCVLGIFFTEAQLDHIASLRDRDGNSGNELWIGWVAKKVGRRNIEAMIGIPIKQAQALQFRHDCADPKLLLQEVKVVLKNGCGVIGSTYFELGKDD